MFTHWNDLDHTFSLFGDFRNQMDRVWNEWDARAAQEATPRRMRGPAMNLFDTESSLVLTAEVPGLSDKDVTITLHEGVLTIAGERKSDAPKGYRAHRQERGSYAFSKSLSLPVKIDAERTVATVKAGVLTIELAKAAEAKPRQIAVRGAEQPALAAS